MSHTVKVNIRQCHGSNCLNCRYWGPPGCRKGILMKFLREKYPEDYLNIIEDEDKNNYYQKIEIPRGVKLKWAGLHYDIVEIIKP